MFQNRLISRDLEIMKGKGGEDMVKKRFSPMGESALRWAELTAVQLGHSYVGSEHLLTGALRTGDLRVRRVLGEEPVSYTHLDVYKRQLQILRQ